MLRFFKKTAKIVGAIILVLMTVCLILIHVFFKPKSDADIYEIFQEFDAIVQIDTKYIQNKKIRIISTQKELDTTLPNIVFVHGSPGSAMDFTILEAYNVCAASFTGSTALVFIIV